MFLRIIQQEIKKIYTRREFNIISTIDIIVILTLFVISCRAIYWKQWKKVKTRYNMINKYGMAKWKTLEMANCRKGVWRASLMLNSVLTNKELANLGISP